MRPDITFFGQPLPARVSKCLEADRDKVDLLLVLGTSLSVSPASSVLGYLPHKVPQVLINRTLVRPRKTVSDGFDVALLGDCDAVTSYLGSELGWTDAAVSAAAAQGGTDTVPVASKPYEVVRDGVFAFVGADVQSAALPSRRETAVDEPEETVVCDGCGVEAGPDCSLAHCAQCFDMDLCAACAEGVPGKAHSDQFPAHELV